MKIHAGKDKVTVIPANSKRTSPQRPTRQKLRVAAYCRVSSEKDEQLNSFAVQVSYYTEKITNNPEWKMAGIYADEGITGTSMKHRDDFKRMLRACREGRIDLILCKSVSRFGRNSVDVLRTIRSLRERNIGVIFEKEGVDTRTMNSELILAFLSAFSQSESESIRENIIRGLQMAYAQGTVTLRSDVFGFRKGKDDQVEIDPQQAEVVRNIFQWFLDGSSINDIAQKLKSQKILSPKGKDTWSLATLRGILSNEKYKGDVLLQKTYRPSLFSEKALVNNGELPKYYISGVLPQIVETQIFDRVQEELARRNAIRPASEKCKTPFGRYSGKYALSALVVCGRCGALYRRITWHKRGKVKVVWRCGARQDKAANCPDSPTLEESLLQSAVMRAITLQYVHKDETLGTTLQSIYDVLNSPSSNSEYAIRTRMRELEQERKTYIAKVLDEKDDSKYDFQFTRIKQELDRLQAQLGEVKAADQGASIDQIRMEEIAALLEEFKGSDLAFSDLLVRKAVEEVRVESAERLEVTFKDGNRRVVSLWTEKHTGKKS